MKQDVMALRRKKEAEEARWNDLAGPVEVKKISPEEMEKLRPRRKHSTFFGTPVLPEEDDDATEAPV